MAAVEGTNVTCELEGKNGLSANVKDNAEKPLSSSQQPTEACPAESEGALGMAESQTDNSEFEDEDSPLSGGSPEPSHKSVSRQTPHPTAKERQFNDDDDDDGIKKEDNDDARSKWSLLTTCCSTRATPQESRSLDSMESVRESKASTKVVTESVASEGPGDEKLEEEAAAGDKELGEEAEQEETGRPSSSPLEQADDGGPPGPAKALEPVKFTNIFIPRRLLEEEKKNKVIVEQAADSPTRYIVRSAAQTPAVKEAADYRPVAIDQNGRMLSGISMPSTYPKPSTAADITAPAEELSFASQRATALQPQQGFWSCLVDLFSCTAKSPQKVSEVEWRPTLSRLTSAGSVVVGSHFPPIPIVPPQMFVHPLYKKEGEAAATAVDVTDSGTGDCSSPSDGRGEEPSTQSQQRQQPLSPPSSSGLFSFFQCCGAPNQRTNQQVDKVRGSNSVFYGGGYRGNRIPVRTLRDGTLVIPLLTTMQSMTKESGQSRFTLGAHQLAT